MQSHNTVPLSAGLNFQFVAPLPSDVISGAFYQDKLPGVTSHCRCVQMWLMFMSWPTESRTAALIYLVWFTVGSPLNTVTLSQYIRLCCHLVDKNTTKKYHKTHYGWIYTRAAAQPFSQCTNQKKTYILNKNKFVPKRSLDPLFLLLSKSTLAFPSCRCLIHQHRSYYCTLCGLCAATCTRC